MNAYLNLLRTPGVARIIAAQLTARFPSGMISLGFLLHIEHIIDSYGAAGLVLAATSVGQAIAGPLTSRWMGSGACVPCSSSRPRVCAVGLTTIALVAASAAGLTWSSVLIVGLSYPPVQSAVRTIYPKMVNSRQLTPLFSLDASAAGDHLDRRAGGHDLRRDPDRDGRRHPAHRRHPGGRRDRGSSPPPRSAACASRAASAARQGARQAARAARDRHRLPAHRRVRRDRGRRRRALRQRAAPRPGSCSRSVPVASSSADSRSATCRSDRGRSRGGCCDRDRSARR